MKVRQNVFDTYWKFAAERQEIFFRRLRAKHPPYTKDTILNNYKFCNSYRASDRVSQFLIKKVIYKKDFDEIDTLFRIFLFRLVNKVETWIELENLVGSISLSGFSFNKYEKLFREVIDRQRVIYGNAFILCANKAFGYDEKFMNHLSLLKEVFIDSGQGGEFLRSKSMKDLFHKLKELPLIGNFMAYQLAIDFNYSEVFDFSENDFTSAGPGAIRGIEKCFVDTGGKSYEETIHWMVEQQDKEFARLGISFKDLFGRKLHAIDCQNLFCETDKYCRVKFPELKIDRVKIKSKFQPDATKIELFYPPKWGISEKVRTVLYNEL